jgi:hypothetical protein
MRRSLPYDCHRLGGYENKRSEKGLVRKVNTTMLIVERIEMVA